MALRQPLSKHFVILTLVVRVCDHLLVEGLAGRLERRSLLTLGSLVTDSLELSFASSMALILRKMVSFSVVS